MTAVPLNEYVVKIASRCNLRCTYCYEYNLGDTSWRKNARVMSEDTARLVAARIREHSILHQVKQVCVSFHGGEPLLVGAKHLDCLASIFSAAAEEAFELHLTMQTNAMLVTEELCDVISRHKIAVSVSLDGDAYSNDRHRVDRIGTSSYAATMRGIELLQRRVPGQPGGLLAVIDPNNDPIVVFDALASLGISHIDFLLSHHNWDRPPARPLGLPHEYGAWYLKIFEAWTSGRHSNIDIRFFRNVIEQFLQVPGMSESMNLAPVRLITVNSDGAMEGVDTLKSTASGAQRTGLHVGTHSFDDAIQSPLISVRQSSAAQLCQTCRSCEFMRECAGGYFPHRYSSKEQFNNPSVYCKDMFWLLERIQAKLIPNKSCNATDTH